ncbi:MAG: hypothetical protein ACLR43_11485 [Faecalibacillus faecis]
MYICGASYFFVGIILLIVNAFLKKKIVIIIITSIKEGVFMDRLDAKAIKTYKEIILILSMY